MSGQFLLEHSEEILNLVRNVEERENREHPLNRIMAIEPQEGGFMITFTDFHLARGVGEAIRHAYQGDLQLEYPEEGSLLRMRWAR